MQIPEPPIGGDDRTARPPRHLAPREQGSEASRLAHAIGRALHLQESETELLVACLHRIERIEQEVHALRTAKAAGGPAHPPAHQGPDETWREPHPSRGAD